MARELLDQKYGVKYSADTFKCVEDGCEKEFNRRDRFFRHWETHHYGPSEACNECGEHFKTFV